MLRLPASLLITFVLSGPAFAQGDARFCGSYAANMSGVADLAIKKNPACLDYSKGVHGSYQSHFEWCMKNPASSVQGAEANIRRLVSACTGNASSPAAAPRPPTARAPSGGQEPFGQNIGAWSFTQDTHSTGVLCRAKAPAQGGLVVIGRYGNGSYYLHTPSYGLPKGRYEEASIVIAGQTEMNELKSDGQTTFMQVSEDEVQRIIRAKGWQWRASVKGRILTGSAVLDSNVGAAVARLRECTKANGGR